jgi:diguanylate cyclase (GGDEF)-like protein
MAEPAPPELSLWTLVVLPLICAAYGLLPLVVDSRLYFTFEAPTVILAGLVGGPVAGVLAGVGTGIGDVNAVWRRRSAYAGLAMLHGFAAGLTGDGWRSGAIPLAAAVAISAGAYLAISGVGLGLVMLDRGSWNTERLARAIAIDAGELTIAAPLVALLASTFASSPWLTSLAVASGFAVIAFSTWALASERSRAERERLALLTDPLTGALSRAAFEDTLAREHARVLRGDRPVGLVICDVDHFGQLNERFGHLGGDQALRFVVDRIAAAARTGDVLARWGGDELCLIAPGIGALAELEELCERVRSSVADAWLSLDGEHVPVTISIGATLLADWTGREETFARADEALYVAKRTRDAVCVLPPLPPEAEGASWQLVGAG